ncbi:MAG: ABC transporter ATP-binding protein [Chloroflexota bacterium]
MDAIVCNGLSKRFGAFLAVNGLTFSVPAGSVFGFLGHNGAGKTTTIKILAGLSHPTAGGISVFGRPWSRSSLDDIGLLPENPVFFGWMSGREYLAFLAKLAGIPAGEQLPRADEMLALTGLTEAAKRPCGNYSRGMKQRLGLAAALIHKPRVLLLDEPTSALDPEGRREVLELIASLREQGLTVFLSSHILADIERVADTVLIIKNGQRVAGGSLSELLAEQARPLIDIDFAAVPPPDAAARLSALRNVTRVTGEGRRVTVRLRDQNEQQELLAALASAGLAIDGFNLRRPTLEDVYISVTASETPMGGDDGDE